MNLSIHNNKNIHAKVEIETRNNREPHDYFWIDENMQAIDNRWTKPMRNDLADVYCTWRSLPHDRLIDPKQEISFESFVERISAEKLPTNSR